MAKTYISMLLVHILLPIGLLLSIALRPFGLSVFYLLLYLLAPLIPSVNQTNVKGWRGNFFLINMIVPICLLLVHGAWHSVLAAFAPYGSLLETVPLLKRIGCNLGLVSYASIDPLMTMHYLAPELVMTFTSIVVCIGVKKLLSDPSLAKERKDSKHQKFPLLTRFGKYISLFLIMLSGILKPSVTSGIYFLVFIGSATAWSVGQSLEKGFAVVLKCVMAIMAAHISILFTYQCSWLSDFVPPDMNFARYFGLVKFVNLNDTTTESTTFTYDMADGHIWETFGSPIVILITYYILAIESRELFKPKEKKKSALTGIEAGKVNGSLIRGVSFNRGGAKDKWKIATSNIKAAFSYISSKSLRDNRDESAPLIQKVSANKRWPSLRSKSKIDTLRQDSTGSVIVADDETSQASTKSTLLDDIVSAILDLSQVLVRSSYIATTITMMAWSIMFHSWLTFVFLMWANIVWLRQDQRTFMLKTSPILVCYAVLLLLLQYIYAMDLNESELPSNVTAVNMRQIGVGRVEGEPVVPLVVKSLFTWMFWVTLRQRVSELRRRRTSAVLTDMAAPLQLTVSAAASVIEAQREEEHHSRLLHRFGVWLRAACARYWIYVVVIMLFVIGITGERMTIFRIIYMMLFLIFILMFQISWYWWRRLMYLFWITVIIYSMINLILIYVYQFDNFSKTIETYLLINERLQHDLGLEPYHPADLFVKLLTPTCFLIITIMQVHYFHKDFMALSEPRILSYRTDVKDAESERQSQAGASTMKDDLPPLPLEGEEAPVSMEGDEDLTSMRSVELSTLNTKKSMPRRLTRTRSYAPTITEQKSTTFKPWAMQTFGKIKTELNKWKNLMFIYLDIHLVKVIFVALMLLCVINTCAMHVPIIVIIAPVILLKSRQQRYCLLVISTIISIYFLLKMVYQIDYIEHSFFDVNCTVMTENNTMNMTTYSNAEWVGFYKVTKEKPLATIVKSYISLIVLFTFYSLVTYRQQTIRKMDSSIRSDASRKGDKLMFPDITRMDADTDLLHCAKYLMNYGFYKFGVEITLMCLMGVIGSRMDLYAVFYAGWLMVLVSITRNQIARIWPAFTGCVTVMLPVQYLMAVGFMPQFCIDYPWSGEEEQMKHVRSWLFLPYTASPPHATKLIFDFFLLLFASRQLRVFRLERAAGPDSPSGDNNENIGQDWETPTFVNPVPDFLGYVGTWLDVVKRMVFLGMLWVTLAIMFLTGTNRVNLFSMGYLIGSFIFLWQGTDFYLRPKKAILHWWSWLLRYNVSVVVVKSLLQIPGCMFSAVMQRNACWLVQLLGIGCVDKFAGGNIARFLKMHYTKQEVCSVPQEDIGLAWDGVCFAFLILQRRLFLSYYFYRVIDESKATTVLASRGAELIEELREKQMLIQEAQEVKILEKIKIKMERIKANQKKVQGNLTKDPKNHDADEEEEDDTQVGESEGVALVRSSSGGGRGFHTPDSAASPRGFHTPLSEPSAPPSPSPSSRPLPPLPGLGPPASPSSALMTVSLDAYLEPRRISFESPATSEMVHRVPSPEESYPVFSPPPIRRRHTLAVSPSRASGISVASISRAEPNSHHTWTESDAAVERRIFSHRHEERYRRMPTYSPPASHQKAIRSGDYYMFDEFDDTEIHVHDEESSSEEEGPKEMGIGKLLSTALKTDLKHAVSMRRASMPAFRQARPHSLGTIPHSYPKEVDRKSSRLGMTREADVNVEMSERRQPDDGEDSELEDEEYQETWFSKLRMYFDTAIAFINSILVSITRHLMKFSRDYRYVSRTLSIEKKILKEKEGFGIGLREGSQMIWAPLPETLISHRKLSDISVPEIRILAPSMERGLDEPPPPLVLEITPLPSEDEDDTSEHESAFSLQTTSSKDLTAFEEQDDSMFNQETSPLVHLGYALWYAVLAHTDIVCYIMVFINQIQSATILSIPLPLMVFMWGTLTIPRPTKTFWVTLIAYTEVIVLIKSMFQFEILPWNQVAIPANMPFTAPRIIGIERKPNYALYDLILLLIIFLHRFMLKSLGLWKESTPEPEVREDMEYHLSDDDKMLVVEGRASELGKKYIHLHNTTGPGRVGKRRHRMEQAIEAVMQELRARRSDVRVVQLVSKRLQAQGNLRRRKKKSKQLEAENEVDDRLKDHQIQTVDRQEAGPSKPPEDDHFSVNDDKEPIIAVTTTLEEPYDNYSKFLMLSVKRYLQPMHYFFTRMLEPGARVTADVYAYMFLCDFFNFLVVIFGFAAFGTHQGDGGVQTYLEENKVPIPFLVMLILQFGLIVIDRALYLRKFILGKILFQYALIIGVHIWMFFVLPFITERTFNALLPPPMWYMLKCLYLLLSAYQIRCGYPRRIIGNFLCKSYRFLNMTLFRGFMAVPFVFELRTLMDWIWTDTSMTLMDWLKMEDIFASVFLLKCSRYVEDEFPQPRGEKKSSSSKYLLGGGVLAFVIAIIWFPLVFFAFGNTVGEPNPPSDVTVKIRIGPFLPVYQMSAQSHNIDMYSEQDYTQLSNIYARDRTAQTFLSNYMYNDIAVVTINPNSTMTWEISPPELDRLEREANSNATLTIKFSYVITHPTNSAQNPPTIDEQREVSLHARLDSRRNPERDKLLQLLAGTASSDTWINVKLLFPKFVKVFNKGTVKPAYQLMPPTNVEDAKYFRDVQLRLERNANSMYWRVREACEPQDPLLSIPMNNCDMLIMYTFNDKLFPETLNFISGSGIIGLYTTFVFLASRVLRGFFSGIYTKIMFDDLPNVDRVLQLCLDIYLVREAVELALEEDLFAKLVFLYRSPETMIKWSRPKEEEPRALPPPE